MENLMDLVAASFARHGIECPGADSHSVWGRVTSPSPIQAEHSLASRTNHRANFAHRAPRTQLQEDFREDLSVETGLAPSHSAQVPQVERFQNVAQHDVPVKMFC